MRILIVCTANMCRSPLAAAMLDRALDQRGVAADVRSAGLMPGGRPMPADGLRVAREHGLDLTGHVSQELDLWTAERADLILTMTREQGRTILADAPELWSRTFTLISFRGWLGMRPVGGLGQQLGLIAGRRQRSEMLGSGPDDVADPIRQRPAAWRRLADLLDDETGRLAGRVAALQRGNALEAR